MSVIDSSTQPRSARSRACMKASAATCTRVKALRTSAGLTGSSPPTARFGCIVLHLSRAAYFRACPDPLSGDSVTDYARPLRCRGRAVSVEAVRRHRVNWPLLLLDDLDQD